MRLDDEMACPKTIPSGIGYLGNHHVPHCAQNELALRFATAYAA
jgi:hypothetical protein